jgi:hypothetical protein
MLHPMDKREWVLYFNTKATELRCGLDKDEAQKIEADLLKSDTDFKFMIPVLNATELSLASQGVRLLDELVYQAVMAQAAPAPMPPGDPGKAN